MATATCCWKPTAASPGSFHFWQEWIEGDTLDKAIPIKYSSQGSFRGIPNVHEWTSLVRSLMVTLQDVHAMGVQHGDLQQNKPPMSLTTMGDGSGRRMGMWSYMESNAHAKGTSFILVVGMFMGGAEGTGRSQQLQVVFNKSDVVEDFTYSGGTSNMNFGSNPFGNNVQMQSRADNPMTSK